MDWVTNKEAVLGFLKKYRYVLIILLAGILLMVIPTEKTEAVQPVTQSREQPLQESLAQILSKVSGAGKVEVLLTEATGKETVYQLDESTETRSDSRDIRTETVILSGSGREEAGLVRQVRAPTYLGAVIVCQGADSAAVRLAIVEAVKSATGLSANCISVLKMK